MEHLLPEGEPVDKDEDSNASTRKTKREEGAKHESNELRNAPPLWCKYLSPENYEGRGGET